MPSHPHTAKGFGAADGERDFSYSWAQLVWAAITVGKAESRHLLRFGRASGFEILYRIAIVYANLRESRSGRLRKTSAFEALDPSEKGAISYFLGLTTAKLLSERQLGVSWLMHLDVYRDRLSPIITRRGKVKPDLIGRNRRGDWVVVEAKGRSGALPRDLVSTAKEQTQNLLSVSGKTISTRIGHAAYFRGESLATSWEDPPPDGRKASRLELSQADFETSYYDPIRALIESRSDSASDRGPLQIAPLPELDMVVGLARDAGLHSGTLLETQDSQRSDAREYLGGDGVYVSLGDSWGPRAMRLEPTERSPIELRRRVG